MFNIQVYFLSVTVTQYLIFVFPFENNNNIVEVRRVIFFYKKQQQQKNNNKRYYVYAKGGNFRGKKQPSTHSTVLCPVALFSHWILTPP